MRHPLGLLAAALPLLAWLPAHGAVSTRDWGVYGNPRFNFGACFPKAFHGQGEATNGDGERFRTRDGAELAVYGSNVDAGTKLGNGLETDVAEIAGKAARVSYRVQKRNWIVASGTGPKGEFFLKRYLRQDQLLSFNLLYPARLHAHYAPLVARMVGCFTIGSEPGE
jgi:hypothetical protein